MRATESSVDAGPASTVGPLPSQVDQTLAQRYKPRLPTFLEGCTECK